MEALFDFSLAIKLETEKLDKDDRKDKEEKKDAQGFVPLSDKINEKNNKKDLEEYYRLAGQCHFELNQY